MGVQSHNGVQNVQKILFGAHKGRSHKTSRSYNRGSFIAGTTVCIIWNSVAIFQEDLTELHLVCYFTFLMISFTFNDLGKLYLGFLETVLALFSLVLIL